MKSIAVVPKSREVRIVEEAEPRLETPTQARLRMLDVGVCGTDREICAFEYGTPPPGRDYLVLGHESLGEVREVGPGATRVRPGDLVVPMVRRPCPHAHCS
jgi:threonine dehydrogenase-like Zn-dependent dehydrogenase